MMNRRTCQLALLLVLWAFGSAERLFAQSNELLAEERLALLPADEREAWLRYIEQSRIDARIDAESMDAELESAGLDEWEPAVKRRSSLFSVPYDSSWFEGSEAARIADILLSFQTPSGGWAKNVDFRKRERGTGESYYSGGSWSYIGTFDNDATTEEIRFLAKTYMAGGDARYRDAAIRGLEYILRAQFPNGCWPQVYPLQGGYHDAATFNDEAIPNILALLRRVRDGEFPFVSDALRRDAGTAVEDAVICILDAQVEVDGILTAWGQQHDPLTLEPTHARAYEHASLTAGESVDVVEFLMGIDEPTDGVIRAVHAAVDWFRAVALYDLAYDHPQLRSLPGAGPVWARFYEIGTNRPIFSNRDGVILYDWHEIEDERRRGYAWFRYRPADVLAEFEAWSRRHPIER
jgi:PelA/Pel-15E family pectate lyase